MNEIARFLSRFPPFDHLSPELLDRVAAGATVRGCAAGEDVFIEDGPPVEHLYVVYRGSLELRHDEEVIDILEPGECFGHLSLLTGMAPAFTVRGHEPSECILIGRDLALEVLGRPAGARFIAVSLREWLTRAGHTVHALPALHGTHVTGLLQRGPVFCDASDPIRFQERLRFADRVIQPARQATRRKFDRDAGWKLRSDNPSRAAPGGFR